LRVREKKTITNNIQRLVNLCQVKSLLETPLKVDSVQVSSLHRLLNILFKQPPVGLELQRGLLVQRIFRVGLQEKVLEPIDYGVDGENRFPVLSEDVQADVALQVDIGVVHLRLALHLRGLMRVGSSNLETECELTMSIKALIRVDHKFEA